MRKSSIATAVFFMLLMSTAVPAQVFRTADPIRNGEFHLGVAPLLLVNGGTHAGLFLYGGLGVTNDIGLYLNTRLANNNLSYFGLDLDWSLIRGAPSLSLITGVHVSHPIALEGTLNITFPIRHVLDLYMGVDMDVEITHGDTYVPVWFFMGPQIPIQRNVVLLLEVGLGITDPAPNIIGVGLGFFL
jgi:hypothetical protein